MKTSIRLARKRDLPDVLAIFTQDALGGHAESRRPAELAVYEAAFERIAASGSNWLYVAEQEGAIVGTFQLTLIPGLVNHGRLRAKVESVQVLADRRGLGIGAEMMRFAIAEARQKGAGMVELTSNKKRRDAHRFYERLGFDRSHEGFKMVFEAADS